MRAGRVVWVSRDRAAARPGAPAFATAVDQATELRPTLEPATSARDEAIFLLHTAAEIEHALMVQYLYAAYSLKAPEEEPQHAQQLQVWFTELIDIARQEMGHLATVQNVLRALGAPLNWEREDYPFRSEFYPFHFQLEPLSKHSLARYVLAERPLGLNDEELAQLEQAAETQGTQPEMYNRVGALFAQLSEHLARPDVELLPDTVGHQADASWGLPGMVVRTIDSTSAALQALSAIALQGEGGDGSSQSHFSRLHAMFRAFPEDWQPTRAVPTNPTTGAETAGTQVVSDPRARAYCQLFDVRYRTLLFELAHAFSAGPGLQNAPRARAFAEMRLMGDLARVITSLPRSSGSSAKAGPPFALPYTLAIPERELDRARSRRDLLRASELLLQQLGQLSPGDAVLTAVARHDAAVAAEIGAVLPPPVRGISAIRLLPPLAIGRLGAASEPLDNYTLEQGEPFAKIVPAETLVVDRASGRIVEARTPDVIRFKEGERVRPVAPFIEVWAQFEQDGSFRPLTRSQLEELGGKIRWRVRVANHKVARRTRDARDRVLADSGEISDSAVHTLVGTAENFKNGKSIVLGTVQVIDATPAFPQLRLRFTPAGGLVFGSNAGDANIADDVYQPTGTGWVGYTDSGQELTTNPGGIYAANDQGESLGYLDDTCDGIVEVKISLPEKPELLASARIASGPPDYAPDAAPIRNVSDELEQVALGPSAADLSAEQRLDLVIDLVRRAAGTVSLMHTDSMNSGGMAAHDVGRGRAGELIFRPATRASYRFVKSFHVATLRALLDYRVQPGDSTRGAAHGAAMRIDSLLRDWDAVGDLSDRGRQRMPAMMRGSDSLHLALTRRQRDAVRRLVQDLAPASQPGPSAEAAMLALVQRFAPFAPLHAAIASQGGALSQAFADPPQVLAHLRAGTVQGNRIPELGGRALVVAGDPAASAFMSIISDARHPMAARFNDDDRRVVREWILSL